MGGGGGGQQPSTRGGAYLQLEEEMHTSITDGKIVELYTNIMGILCPKQLNNLKQSAFEGRGGGGDLLQMRGHLRVNLGSQKQIQKTMGNLRQGNLQVDKERELQEIDYQRRKNKIQDISEDNKLLFINEIMVTTRIKNNINQQKLKRDQEKILQNNFGVEIYQTVIKIFLYYLKVRQEQYVKNLIKFINTEILRSVEDWGAELSQDNVQAQDQLIITKINQSIDQFIPDVIQSAGGSLQGWLSHACMSLRCASGPVQPRSSSAPGSRLIPNLQHYVDRFQHTKLESSHRRHTLVEYLLYQFVDSSNDFDMNLYTLKLLFKNSMQIKSFLRTIKNIQIITHKQELENCVKIMETAENFKAQCEKSELWLKDPFKHVKGKLEYKTEIYDILIYLRDINKFFIKERQTNIDQCFTRRQTIYNMQVNISMQRQFIVKNLDIHKNVINLLKEGLIIIENCFNERQLKIIEIFQQCFIFLQYFCKNENKINKKILFRHNHFFLKFLKYTEIGQTDFINELYKNNYKAIQNVSDDILTIIIQKIRSNHTQDQGGHHKRYLQFIEQLLYYKNAPIKQNMNKLVNFLSDLTILRELLFMKANRHYNAQLDQTRYENELKLNMSSSMQLSPLIRKSSALAQPEEEAKKRDSQSNAPSERHGFGRYVFDFSIRKKAAVTGANQPGTQQLPLPQQSQLLQQAAGAGRDPRQSQLQKIFDMPIIYHAQILYILSNVVQECQNGALYLKGILKKLLKIEYILFLLNKTDHFQLGKEENSYKAKLIFDLKVPLCKMFLQLYNDAESQNYIVINMPRLTCINNFMDNYLEYLFSLEKKETPESLKQIETRKNQFFGKFVHEFIEQTKKKA